MKPLPLAPLTDEDEQIWSEVVWMCGRRISMLSDRRDAERMRWAAVWRGGPWCMRESGVAHASWQGALFYQGELPFGGSHYMTYRVAHKG
jgi:hypothetical protein